MIIDRALFREAAVTSIGIIVVLTLLMLFVSLTQALGKVALGRYTGEIFLHVFTLKMIRVMDTILPLGLFLGILFSVSRWYRDSEMTVLSACGVSLIALLRPILFLALIFAVFAAISSMYFSPVASMRLNDIRDRTVGQVVLSGMKAGVFSETSLDRRVFYVEKVDEKEGRFENVFLSSIGPNLKPDERQVVVVASSGQQLIGDDGEKYMALENGRSYEGLPGASDYQIVEFDRYMLRLKEKEEIGRYKNIYSMKTKALMKSTKPEHVAEFHWRLARPIATMILAVLAMILAYTDPRRGRLGNMFVAILVFFFYTNLLGVGSGMLKNGKVPVEVGLWWIHILFLVITVLLFYRRLNNKPLIPLPRWWR